MIHSRTLDSDVLPVGSRHDCVGPDPGACGKGLSSCSAGASAFARTPQAAPAPPFRRLGTRLPSPRRLLNPPAPPAFAATPAPALHPPPLLHWLG
jgi:hypothetical protein